MVGTARRLVPAGVLAPVLLSATLLLIATPTARAQQPANPNTMVVDLAPFAPLYAGELLFLQQYAGLVVGAELEAKLVSQETDPWAVSVSFSLPTGSLTLSSAELGWQGVGTFETKIVSHALDGLIEPPADAYHLVGFMAWAVNVGALPGAGGSVGFEPFDAVFEVLRLTVHFAPCPFGHPLAPFDLLGGGVGGAAGTPRLTGAGSLCPGEPGELRLKSGPPDGVALVVLGGAAVDLPLFGGTLVPAPELLLAPLALDAAGTASQPFDWPLGAPPGLELWLQAWIPDPTAPLGLAASNGLHAVAPGT